MFLVLYLQHWARVAFSLYRDKRQFFFFLWMHRHLTEVRELLINTNLLNHLFSCDHKYAFFIQCIVPTSLSGSGLSELPGVPWGGGTHIANWVPYPPGRGNSLPDHWMAALPSFSLNIQFCLWQRTGNFRDVAWRYWTSILCLANQGVVGPLFPPPPAPS